MAADERTCRAARSKRRVAAPWIAALAAGLFGLGIGNGKGTLTMVEHAAAATAADEALKQAILERDAAAVEAALRAGAGLDSKGFLGETPALLAATTDAWDLVLLLLERGADPAAANDRGLSIAKRAADSRVSPDGREGRALAKVKSILKARHLL